MGEFLIIFFLSFIPRILFLFFGMPSITHDEADYFLNSYMLAKTKSDFWGNSFFLTSGLLSATSAIPIYINSFSYLLFPKTIFFSRLFFTLINIFTPIIFYYLIKKITQNKQFSFFSFLVLNFSPWFLYLSSQINFESILSGFFYILSFLIFVSNLNKFKKIPLFLLTSFLSFNSYMGIKTSFLFLLILIFLTNYLIKNNLNIKNFLKSILYPLFIYLFLIIISITLPNNKLILKRANSDLIFLNKNLLENKVWFERITTDSSEFIKKIISNKLTVIFNHLINNFFYTISPLILFLKGDPHPIYGNNLFGLFYLWQFIFLIIGIIYVFKIPNFKKTIPLLLIIIFGSLPTIISIFEPTLALRSFPIIFGYSIIISNGIYQVINFKKINKFKKILNSFFLLLFLISFLYFFLIFQTRIKILSSEQWHLGEKKLFEKILKEEPQSKKIYIVNNEPKETFMLFAFYHLNDA
ncbi:MAG: hypothetical protein N2Z85_00500, partial [Patescibacteria group bacterium]|nr:hypothetical protein [Patescibacteria group bacterium]